MKLKNLFLVAAAALSVAVACQKENGGSSSKPTLTVSPLELSFEATDAASQSVTINANYRWTAVASDSWIVLGAESGNASTAAQTLSISVEDNANYDRSGEVTIAIGGYGTKIVTINQKGAMGEYVVEEGDGTLEHPYNISQAFELVKDLTWESTQNHETVGPFYVVGKISTIKEAYSAQYGNAQFTLSDDGGVSGTQFTAYRVNYLGNKKWVEGNKQISQGDVAVIYGKLQYYGTGADGKARLVETETGAYLYSLNGETEATGGQTIDYENAPATTVAEFIAKADVTNYYKLTGTVSKFSAQYCSFDLTDASGAIFVYSVANKDDWASKVTNDATVTLAGKYKYYEDKQQHEVVDAYIISCEGGNTPEPVTDTPSGTGTLDDPFNPKAAYDAAAALASGAESEQDYYIAGKVASITYTFDAQHGTATFNISETGETSGVTQFTCYGVYYLGNRAWVDGDLQVAVGDDVIICGRLFNFKGNTPETASKKAYIYSLNGTTAEEAPKPFAITKFAQTQTGFVAECTNVGAGSSYTWYLYEGDNLEDYVAYAYANSNEIVFNFSDAEDEEFDGECDITEFTVGTKYTVTIEATDVNWEDYGPASASFTARDMSGAGDEVTVTWDKEKLADAACNGAVVNMDDVISFVNSTIYDLASGSAVTELRVYKNQTLEIKADGATITKIEMTCTANGSARQGPGSWGAGAPEGYTFEASGKNGTWEGSASSVKFTASSNQVRIATLSVTYKK